MRDTSTPAGAALENEEMRRIALNVNELADKLDKIGGGAASPAKTTKNISGGGGGDVGGGGGGGDKPRIPLKVQQRDIVKVPDAQTINFRDSAQIGVLVYESPSKTAVVQPYLKSSFAVDAAENSSVKVAPARTLDFIDGTGTTTSVVEAGPGYATVQINATPGIGGVDVYDDSVLEADMVTDLNFIAGTHTSIGITESPAGRANITIDADGLPAGTQHQTIRHTGSGTYTWEATSRTTNQGIGAATAGTAAVTTTWITGDTVPTMFVGSPVADQIAISARSEVDDAVKSVIYAQNTTGSAVKAINTSNSGVTGNNALYAENTQTGSGTTTTAYILNGGTGRGLHAKSTGGIAIYGETTGGSISSTAAYIINAGGANGLALSAISTATNGSACYFQGQGNVNVVEVVKAGANGTGVYVAATGADVHSLHVIGSSTSGNVAAYIVGNVQLHDSAVSLKVEFNEAYGSIGIQTAAVADKALALGGYTAGAGLVKSVKVPFTYTDTIVDSGIVVPDGATVERIAIDVIIDFDGSAPEAEVVIDGTPPTTVMAAAQSDLASPAQYTVNKLFQITNGGVVQVQVSAPAAAQGEAVACVFYTDAQEV